MLYIVCRIFKVANSCILAMILILLYFHLEGLGGFKNFPHTINKQRVFNNNILLFYYNRMVYKCYGMLWKVWKVIISYNLNTKERYIIYNVIYNGVILKPSIPSCTLHNIQSTFDCSETDND